MPTDEDGTPDLLADNGHLSKISVVRDAVRSLFRVAREHDRQSGETCISDTQQFLLLLCGRIIGGQQRELTEKDRLCLQQVLGFDIPDAAFGVCW